MRLWRLACRMGCNICLCLRKRKLFCMLVLVVPSFLHLYLVCDDVWGFKNFPVFALGTGFLEMLIWIMSVNGFTFALLHMKKRTYQAFRHSNLIIWMNFFILLETKFQDTNGDEFVHGFFSWRLGKSFQPWQETIQHVFWQNDWWVCISQNRFRQCR